MQSVNLKRVPILWLPIALVMGLLLAACNTAPATSPASQAAQPTAAVAAQPTSAPAQAAQPTSAPVLGAPSVAPTRAAAATSQAAPTTAPTRAAPTATQVAPTAAPTRPAATATQSAPPAAPTSAPTAAPVQAAAPAGACSVGATTPAQTEGPYYTANPPQRASLLEPGMPGTKVVLTGYVFTADCQPVANARVDFWQADANGAYDNSGYRLRGYQLTDASGRYQLTTVLPGLYPGRTRHIHVKVNAPNGPVLTSQVYFPGEASNARDSIFDQRLLATMTDTADGKAATLNFVLPGR